MLYTIYGKIGILECLTGGQKFRSDNVTKAILNMIRWPILGANSMGRIESVLRFVDRCGYSLGYSELNL